MRLRRLLSTLRLRLRSVFRRARVEQELDDEIRDHIDRRVAAEVARGVPREQARQEALRAFGGIEQSKEACRDVRRVNVIEHTVQDLRFAARHFARAPIATATMIGIFALGIGFSTALFLFVRSFVERPSAGHPAAGVAGPDPRHRPHPAGSCDRPRVLISRVSGVRGAADAVQRRRRMDIVRYRLRRRHARGEPAERRRDLRHRQLFSSAGSSPGSRRRAPGGRERRRPRAAARRRDQPRAVGETLRAFAGRDRPRDESERRHGHDRRRRTAPIRRRADGRVADARLAAAQHASAGAAHDLDAHQLRRRPLWPRGAPAARCARRGDGTDCRGDRRPSVAAGDVGYRRVHRRRPAARQQLLSAIGRR